jgi:hypothetical protein
MVYRVQHEDISNLENLSDFAPLTFLVSGRKIGGITGFLQATLVMLKDKLNFEHSELNFEQLMIPDKVYGSLVLFV